MLLFSFAGALAWALAFPLVAAKPSPLDLTARNALPASDTGTVQAIRRALSLVERDTVLSNSTTLDKSWNGAVLFSYSTTQNESNIILNEGVTITCTTCYVMGNATAQLTISGDFNATQAFDNIINETRTDFDTIETSAVDYIEKSLETLIKNIDRDINDFSPPTMSNITFNLDVQGVPEALLQLQFDGLELYVQLDTTFNSGATYTVNLFTPETPLAITVPGMDIGVWFVLDLILDVSAEIDISSGFHIKLDDGVQVNIAMFANNASDIIFPGGRFEFLPVTLQTAGVVVSATLRLSAKAGIALKLPEAPDLTIFNHSAPTFGGGIIAQVFADIADLVANVSTAPQDDTCDFRMVAEYSFNLGAGAGATVTLDEHTWGPDVTTSTPLYYTTLADLCATKGNSTTTSSAAASTSSGFGFLAKRALTTTTLTSTQIYTGVNCESSGLINCPGSLQTTLKSTTTLTLVTAVPSGSTATFPTLTANSVPSPVAFGLGAHNLVMLSGSPTSYVPGSASTASTPHSIIQGSTGGVSNKVIIGVSVGVGVPVVAAAIASCLFFLRRRKHGTTATNGPTNGKTPGTPATPGSLWTPTTPGSGDYFDRPHKKSSVLVREVGRR